jgi:hypothetical protein
MIVQSAKYWELIPQIGMKFLTKELSPTELQRGLSYPSSTPLPRSYLSKATLVPDGAIGRPCTCQSLFIFVCAVRHEDARSVPKFCVLNFDLKINTIFSTNNGFMN